jgi:transcriptional regulator GlxA family with amidase domain
LVRSAKGLVLQTDALAAYRPSTVDTLVVPGSRTWRRCSTTRSRSSAGVAMRRASGVARRMTSVCIGAFLLAAAGLLDQKCATTRCLVFKKMDPRWVEEKNS